MSPAIQEKIRAMRDRASNLFSWYGDPPTASEMLTFLDAVEDALLAVPAPQEPQ